MRQKRGIFISGKCKQIVNAIESQHFFRRFFHEMRGGRSAKKEGKYQEYFLSEPNIPPIIPALMPDRTS
jgi:hypothetical protein